MMSDNLLEFDYLITGKSEQYANLDEYYESLNPLRDVDDISCPMLAIAAADDPICDATKILYDLFSGTPNFFLCLSEYGGHCGFKYSCFNHGKQGQQQETQQRLYQQQRKLRCQQLHPQKHHIQDERHQSKKSYQKHDVSREKHIVRTNTAGSQNEAVEDICCSWAENLAVDYLAAILRFLQLEERNKT